ncbi:MAG: diguanylate cyclase [Nitrospiraceae bacterium]
MRNGTWVLIQWSCVPTGDGQVHLAESITDITALKQEQARTNSLNIQLQEANRQLTHLNEQLRDKSVRDGLTGLYNHSYFQESIAQLAATAERTNSPLSLIFIDLDNFKEINDRYGHKAGDEVLRGMGWLLDSRQTLSRARISGGRPTSRLVTAETNSRSSCPTRRSMAP